MSDRRMAAAAAIAVGLLAALAVFFLLRGGERQPPAEVRPAAPAPERPAVAQAARPAAPPPAPAAKAADQPKRALVDQGPAGGSIEGAVISNATGLGIEGAEITFQRDEGATAVRSGPGGAFSFAPPSAGRYRVAAVAADGYLPFAPAWGHSMLTVDFAAGRRVRGIAIRLSPAVEYTVAVVGQKDAPAAGAEVRVLGAASGELALLPLPDRYTTDANGEAKVRAPDDAMIEARHAGGAGRASIDFAARASRRVTVRLHGARAGRAPKNISGSVVDERREPVGSALVIAHPPREAAPPGETVADAEGRFAVSGLDRGVHELEARAEGRAPAFERAEAGASGVVIQLGPGAKLAGRVADGRSGAPVPSFTVQVWRRTRPLISTLHASRAFVDANGEYEMADVGPGPAAVVIAAPGYAPSDEIAVQLSSGQVARADASLQPGARVRGRAVEADSKKPLPGARVALEGRRGEAGGPALATSVIADEQGAFVVDGLAPGPVALFVTADDHHARIFNAVVPARGDAPEVVVALTKLRPGEEPSIELAGIGAVLSAEGEALLIQRAMPGGGAAEAGLQRGDKIVSIEGRAIVELGFEGAMNTIRGPEGTSVVLEVQRGGAAAQPVRVWRRLIRPG